jgi:epoxyqueuosine reductase QueG
LNNEKVRSFLKARGIEIVGFGSFSSYDRETPFLPKDVRQDYPFLICLGLSLSRGVIETLEDGPNLLYLHHYRQLNYALDGVSLALARFIEDEGFRAIPFAASQVVDWERQRAHISHKHVGVACHMGWIGRNNLLIHPRYGARVRYTTVITDMPFEPETDLERSSCGSCRRCLSFCPAGAIGEDHFDHLLCFETLKKFRKERNIGHFICGLCVKACLGGFSSP